MMGAGANDFCLVDADEKVGLDFKSYSLSDFPNVDELLVWHAKQKLPKNFGESQLLRYPIFSTSIQLLPGGFPKDMVGEMETAGKLQFYNTMISIRVVIL